MSLHLQEKFALSDAKLKYATSNALGQYGLINRNLINIKSVMYAPPKVRDAAYNAKLVDALEQAVDVSSFIRASQITLKTSKFKEALDTIVALERFTDRDAMTSAVGSALIDLRGKLSRLPGKLEKMTKYYNALDQLEAPLNVDLKRGGRSSDAVDKAVKLHNKIMSLSDIEVRSYPFATKSRQVGVTPHDRGLTYSKKPSQTVRPGGSASRSASRVAVR